MIKVRIKLLNNKYIIIILYIFKFYVPPMMSSCTPEGTRTPG
jgi:hypothetical protein